VVQLLETPFVNLINFASLVTTNAARHRFVAGKSKLLLEFGLRRAQVLNFIYIFLYGVLFTDFMGSKVENLLFVSYVGPRWWCRSIKILLHGRL
jgi:nicotinic acid phosphoribosyltransferase